MTSEQSGQFHYGTFRQNEPVSPEVYPSPTHVTERVFVEQKRTGFRRSEFREETHEKACVASIYYRNRALIRATPRRHIGKVEKFLASPLTKGEEGAQSKASRLARRANQPSFHPASLHPIDRSWSRVTSPAIPKCEISPCRISILAPISLICSP